MLSRVYLALAMGFLVLNFTIAYWLSRMLSVCLTDNLYHFIILNVHLCVQHAGKVADKAASRKEKKCLCLSSMCTFWPIAVENLGVFSSSTLNFVWSGPSD